MFLRIVKFNDNSYGVRSWGLFGFSFADESHIFWSAEGCIKKYCHFTLEKAIEIYTNLTDKGKPLMTEEVTVLSKEFLRNNTGNQR